MTADELAALGRAIEARFGLDVDDRPAAIAELGIRRAALRGDSVATYIARVGSGEVQELRALASELTVGETYFFRHAEQFHAFADVALPARLAARGRIRVLSAGCASGEEAYTLAMIARDRAVDTHVAIQAIDVNPVALERAARARYSRWALRATPPELEARWFAQDGRDVVLAAPIRAAVAFAEHNLVDDGELWTPGRWDVVFCRNVLMYFSDARAQRVIDRIVRALAPGGYLFLGHAETLRGRADELELCHTHGTFYYQRHPATAIASPPWIPSPAPAGLDPAWFGEIKAATARVHAIVDGALAAYPARAPEPTAAGLDEIRALYAQERFAEALDRLAALPEAIGASHAAILLRALVLTHAGRIADAEAACATLLAADPARADAHYLRALCRDSAGDPGGAAEHARRAAEADPSFAMARVQLGLLARRAGDPRAAAGELARAIVLLEGEDPARLALFGGGFGRQALLALCRAELAAGARA